MTSSDIKIGYKYVMLTLFKFSCCCYELRSGDVGLFVLLIISWKLLREVLWTVYRSKVESYYNFAADH